MSVGDGLVQIGPPDGQLTVRLRGEQSAGGLALVELVMEPDDSGPPLHVHPTHGEGFYVLAGELTAQVGEEIVTGGPGTWVFAPKDTPHTLANLGTRQVRLLVVCTPAGFESYFQRRIAERDGTPPPEHSVAEDQTRAVGPPLSPVIG